MVLAGILLALGIAPKAAAGALLGSLIPTTLVEHPFWKEKTPQGRTMQLTHYLKNVGLIGGLFLVLADRSTARRSSDHVEIAPPPVL